MDTRTVTEQQPLLWDTPAGAVDELVSTPRVAPETGVKVASNGRKDPCEDGPSRGTNRTRSLVEGGVRER